MLSRSPFPSIDLLRSEERRIENESCLEIKTTIWDWLMALPLSHAVYQRTKAMENNENARGVTIAAILGIPVTLAGKFMKIKQAGHQGDNWKTEDSRLRPQPMIRILILAN